ncbi:hypothetical protein ACQY0O_008421 [Thecaphora frezii]
MSRPSTGAATPGPANPESSQQPPREPVTAARGQTSSSFIGRHFGRRPKTTQTYGHDSVQSSSSSLASPPPPDAHSRFRSGDPNVQAHAGLPRSLSSPRVFPSTAATSSSGVEAAHSSAADSASSSERAPRRVIAASRLRPATAQDTSNSRAFPSHDTRSPSSRSPNMVSGSGGGGGNSGGGSSGGGGGSNPFGRMFRRYSQGAGRTDPSLSAPPRDNPALPSSQSHRGPSFLPENRGRSTPPRSHSHASPTFDPPQSMSHGNPPTPSHDATSMTNSRTLAALVDNVPAPNSNSNPDPDALDVSIPSPNIDLSAAAVAATDSGTAAGASSGPPSNVHRIRLVPHLEATRSLHFEPIERDLREGSAPVKVGRFTDRQPPAAANATVNPASGVEAGGGGGGGGETIYSTVGQPGARGGAVTVSGGQGGGAGGVRIDSSRVAFKSKVVSRGHAEIWCESGGKFFIRDTKSSSGTFLNHIRLSAPNVESRPFPIKDGDVIQLGVDYQGGTEEIYRCVKMRVELNRGWQREANQFNVNALRQLRALQGTPIQTGKDRDSETLPTNRQSVSVTDCCICLFSVTVCQALFIAPCSHVFHYKCIRPMLTLHHPGFSCPLCRTFADLEADVEEDEAWQEALLKEAAAAEAHAAQGQPAVDVSTPRVETGAPIALASALEANRLEGGPDATESASNGDHPPAGDVGGVEGGQSLPHLNGGTGRGTAVSALGRAEWARPDTAVAPSVGPLPDVGEFGVDFASLDVADAEDTAVAARAQDGPGASGEDSAPSARNQTSASPIDITRPAHGRARGSAEDGGDPAYPAATRLGVGNLSTPPATGHPSNVQFAAAISPGLDESRTPLNHTFLSTLAEAPAASLQNRDFPAGRTAPADRQMPTSKLSNSSATSNSNANGGGSGSGARFLPLRSEEQQSSDEAEGFGARLSEAGDETETADNLAESRHRTYESELGGTAIASNLKAKAKGRADPGPELRSRDASPDPAAPRGHLRHEPRSYWHAIPERERQQHRSRSTSRDRYGGKSRFLDSDGRESLSVPSSPNLRTGPNINASAYMHGHHHLRASPSHGKANGGGGGSNDGSGPNSPSGASRSPAASGSASAMAKFKKRFTGAA